MRSLDVDHLCKKEVCVGIQVCEHPVQPGPGLLGPPGPGGPECLRPISPFNLAQVYCDLSLHTALESLERLDLAILCPAPGGARIARNATVPFVGWVGKPGQVEANSVSRRFKRLESAIPPNPSSPFPSANQTARHLHQASVQSLAYRSPSLPTPFPLILIQVSAGEAALGSFIPVQAQDPALDLDSGAARPPHAVWRLWNTREHQGSKQGGGGQLLLVQVVQLVQVAQSR